MKKIALLIVLIFFLSGRVWFHLTDGFTTGGIRSHFQAERKWELPDNHADYFSQKYSYLGKGCQSYAFISDDSKYVLKFFKEKHLQPPFWVNFIPINSWKEELSAKKWRQRSTLFNGCVLAYSRLKDECGLLHMQINPAKGVPLIVEIIDKMGINHTLNLQNIPHFIQKKGEPFLATLEKIIFLDREGAKQLLLAVLDLIKQRGELGIRDRDPALVQNLAIVDGKPIFIDLGQLIDDPSIKIKEEFFSDLQEKMEPLLQWLQLKDSNLYDWAYTHVKQSNLQPR